jgi:hypothetical protein
VAGRRRRDDELDVPVAVARAQAAHAGLAHEHARAGDRLAPQPRRSCAIHSSVVSSRWSGVASCTSIVLRVAFSTATRL